MSTVYTLNGKVLKNSANDKWLAKKYVDPYNPLGLPSGVFRIQVNTDTWQGAQTATLVPGTSDTYDVQDFLSTTNWNKSSAIKILGANTTGVTSMRFTFSNCTNLTEVSLFDTTACTSIESMFAGCSSLISIPLFNTSNVTVMVMTFSGCVNVQSGALAIYQQASSQANPPSAYSGCFSNCGRDTVTGAAELAQIPSSWGGTGA